MALIDVDKFVCSLLSKTEKQKDHIKGIGWLEADGKYRFITNLLADQGIIYKNGSLIKIGSKKCEGTLGKLLEEKRLSNSCESCKNEKPHRFKVGDWLVHKDMVGVTCCITQIHEPYYYLTENNSFINFGEEDNFRPWTIQDAKPGDVIASTKCGLYPWIGIVESYNGEDRLDVYCYLEGGHQRIHIKSKRHTTDNMIPANKKQRDILFQKLKKAGYEWDAEALELRKTLREKISAKTREEEIKQAFLEYKSVTETGVLSEGDFTSGAEWADRTMIEKAVKWLYDQANIYTKVDVNRKDESIHTKFYADKMIDDFRKAMEKGD